jgi:hypothetical protein
MPIYERPTKSFMTDWAKKHLSPGQTFNGLGRTKYGDLAAGTLNDAKPTRSQSAALPEFNVSQ